jgi:hypothetical protein
MKTELIVRLYDDLDDGMAVVPRSTSARRSGVCAKLQLVSNTRIRNGANCVGPHPVARFRARDVADASLDFACGDVEE